MVKSDNDLRQGQLDDLGRILNRSLDVSPSYKCYGDCGGNVPYDSSP